MHLLVTLFLLLVGCNERSSHTTETEPLHNPVIETRGLTDPSVISYQGSYYLYPTGDSRGFDVYISTDLRQWRKGPRVLQLDGPNVWAPDVFVDSAGGAFYLYYSANYRVGVAVARGPEGPFEDHGILIADAIDPHMFQDDDRQYYLYYESLTDPEQTIRHLSIPTGRIFVQPMRNPLELGSAPRLLLEPDQPWERGWFRIVEGPWMLKRFGVYYLMYSGNAAFSADYAIGYATAPTPVGPFRKHARNPIAARGAGVFGPGHNAVVAAPDGELWLVYHQKATSNWAWDRYICIDRLSWDDAGNLHIAPTPMRHIHRPG